MPTPCCSTTSPGSPSAGTGRSGVLAVAGAMPRGYYKDPDKTAATFREIGGQRYTVPGDYATIDADGTVHLLGRGSVCINTGGEKVYPEEVEVAARTHPGVADCNAVGVPDERYGEAVTLVVARSPGQPPVSEGDVIAAVWPGWPPTRRPPRGLRRRDPPQPPARPTTGGPARSRRRGIAPSWVRPRADLPDCGSRGRHGATTANRGQQRRHPGSPGAAGIPGGLAIGAVPAASSP